MAPKKGTRASARLATATPAPISKAKDKSTSKQSKKKNVPSASEDEGEDEDDVVMTVEKWPPSNRFTKEYCLGVTKWSSQQYSTTRQDLLKAVRDKYLNKQNFQNADIAADVRTFIGPAGNDAGWFPQWAAARGVADDQMDATRLEWYTNWIRYANTKTEWKDQITTTTGGAGSAESRSEPIHGDASEREAGGDDTEVNVTDEAILETVEPRDIPGTDIPPSRAASQVSGLSMRQKQHISPDYARRWAGTRATTNHHPTPRINWTYAFLEFKWKRTEEDVVTKRIPMMWLRPDSSSDNCCEYFRFPHEKFVEVIETACQLKDLARDPNFHLWYYNTRHELYLDMMDSGSYHWILASWCREPRSAADDLETLKATSYHPVQDRTRRRELSDVGGDDRVRDNRTTRVISDPLEDEIDEHDSVPRDDTILGNKDEGLAAGSDDEESETDPDSDSASDSESDESVNEEMEGGTHDTTADLSEDEPPENEEIEETGSIRDESQVNGSPELEDTHTQKETSENELLEPTNDLGLLPDASAPRDSQIEQSTDPAQPASQDLEESTSRPDPPTNSEPRATQPQLTSTQAIQRELSSSPEPDHPTEHPTQGRTFTPQERATRVFPLAWDNQEERVRKHYRTILSMNDDDDVSQVCAFVTPSDKIDLLKLERFTVEDEDDELTRGDDDQELEQASQDKITASSAATDQQNPASEVVDAKAEEGVSRELEHWTLENFKKFIVFYRLGPEVKELLLHSRTKFNFPSLDTRYPYLQQLFISMIMFGILMNVGVCILGDLPGLGKTTEKELVYRIWVHLDEVKREVMKDWRDATAAEAKGEGFVRRHLPSDSQEGEACPTKDDHIFQCPCQKDAVFPLDKIKAFRGFRLDINQLAQIKTPGMKEAWEMHPGSDSGIGSSGPLMYRVFHPAETKHLGEAQSRAQVVNNEDFRRIAPTYKRSLRADGRFVEPNLIDTVTYDAQRELSVAELNGHTWQYRAQSKAKCVTIATTPHYAKDSGLTFRIWGTQKHLGDTEYLTFQAIPGSRGKYEAVRNPQKDTKRDDRFGVKPGMMIVDEWHSQRGNITNLMKFINEEHSGAWTTTEGAGHKLNGKPLRHALAQEMRYFVEEIPITRVVLMSGTPLTCGAPNAVKDAMNLIASQIKTLTARLHRDAKNTWLEQNVRIPPHLNPKTLEDHATTVSSIIRATEKNFKARIKSETQSGDPDAVKSLRQEVPRDRVADLRRQCVFALEYLKDVMVQRGTGSSMFMVMFGIPIKIHQVNINLSAGNLRLVNEVAEAKESAINKDIRRRMKAQKEKGETVSIANIVTQTLMGDLSVRIAGALPGIVRSREAWAVAETTRLDHQLDKYQKDEDIVWPRRLSEDKMKWSQLDEDEKELATTLTCHNEEMKVRGMTTNWPRHPHTYFRKEFPTLLRVSCDVGNTRPHALLNGALPESKAEMFWVWVKRIIQGTGRTGKPLCGFFTSLSIFELETFRAFAVVEFGRPTSPWFIQEDIDREFFNIYTDNWASPARSNAIDYVLGDDGGPMVQALHTKFNGPKVEKKRYTWLEEEDWKNLTRRPRILMGSGILAEGISATRFDELVMAEPFFIKAKITQMACRPQRITSQWAKRIEIWHINGAYYDTLAMGIYKGPKAAAMVVKNFRKVVNITVPPVLQATPKKKKKSAIDVLEDSENEREKDEDEV